MFKEFTENTISKAKEDIVITQGMLVLIAAVSFITGLIIGILCASGSNAGKSRKKNRSFDASEYARQVNFGDFDDYDDGDDDGSYEYAF